MNKLSCWIIAAVLLILLAACKKTGYEILITTQYMEYHDVQEIEATLTGLGFLVPTHTNDKGQTTPWRERRVQAPRQPGEVYTFFTKNLVKRNIIGSKFT